MKLKHKVKAITPVPGGVGPMTIACLLKNTLECFKAHSILDLSKFRYLLFLSLIMTVAIATIRIAPEI